MVDVVPLPADAPCPRARQAAAAALSVAPAEVSAAGGQLDALCAARPADAQHPAAAASLPVSSWGGGAQRGGFVTGAWAGGNELCSLTSV